MVQDGANIPFLRSFAARFINLPQPTPESLNPNLESPKSCSCFRAMDSTLVLSTVES